MRFLGEVRPESLGRLLEVLPEAVAPLAPFDLALGGVGAFPSAARPRVVWVGVTEGASEVRRVAARVAEAIAPVGWPPEPGEFVPHVTLFRVRSARDLERARAVLEGRIGPPTAPSVRVDGLALKESRLDPGGAVHTVVRTFPMTGRS